MTPTVTIQLDEPHRAYQPGERLTGRFRWDADAADEVRRAEFSVLWYTEGKGDEDFGLHEFQPLPVEPHGGERAWRSFAITLPNSPLSYDGALLKIRWCVRVRVFLSNGKEIAGEKIFGLGRVSVGRVAGA